MHQKDSDFEEAMGSHVATSYALYGGWDYVQGGLHMESGHTLSLKRIMDSANDRSGLLRTIERSMVAEQRIWKTKYETEKVSCSTQTLFTRYSDIHTQQDKLDAIEKHVKKEQIVLETETIIDTKINVLDFDERLDTAARRIPRLKRIAKQKDEGYERDFNFLRDVTNEVDLSLPTYRTDDTGSAWGGLTQGAG
jgi:hypothetical protein